MNIPSRRAHTRALSTSVDNCVETVIRWHIRCPAVQGFSLTRGAQQTTTATCRADPQTGRTQSERRSERLGECLARRRCRTDLRRIRQPQADESAEGLARPRSTADLCAGLRAAVGPVASRSEAIERDLREPILRALNRHLGQKVEGLGVRIAAPVRGSWRGLRRRRACGRDRPRSRTRLRGLELHPTGRPHAAGTSR